MFHASVRSRGSQIRHLRQARGHLQHEEGEPADVGRDAHGELAHAAR